MDKESLHQYWSLCCNRCTTAFSKSRVQKFEANFNSHSFSNTSWTKTLKILHSTILMDSAKAELSRKQTEHHHKSMRHDRGYSLPTRISPWAILQGRRMKIKEDCVQMITIFERDSRGMDGKCWILGNVMKNDLTASTSEDYGNIDISLICLNHTLLLANWQ